MAQTKTKTRRLTENIIFLIVVVCLVLIVAEMAVNVSAEISTQEDQAVQMVPVEEPTALPTLTEEEYQQFLSIESAGATPEP
jgi:hypothetical protein